MPSHVIEMVRVPVPGSAGVGVLWTSNSASTSCLFCYTSCGVYIFFQPTSSTSFLYNNNAYIVEYCVMLLSLPVLFMRRFASVELRICGSLTVLCINYSSSVWVSLLLI